MVAAGKTRGIIVYKALPLGLGYRCGSDGKRRERDLMNRIFIFRTFIEGIAHGKRPSGNPDKVHPG